MITGYYWVNWNPKQPKREIAYLGKSGWQKMGESRSPKMIKWGPVEIFERVVDSN